MSVVLTRLLAAFRSPSRTASAAAAAERAAMVRTQLAARGLDDARVLAAMGAVPRERFVPRTHRARAYADGPLPIGRGQTISQPYVVAFMTQALALTGTERVLEIGTGSGYQTAILAACAREVYSLEILASLAARAGAVLGSLELGNLRLRTADGHAGWPEEAPFDAILVTAAPGRVPEALVEQLAPGGRLVLPVGNREQELVRIEKTALGLRRTSLLPVRFVPMTGRAREG